MFSARLSTASAASFIASESDAWAWQIHTDVLARAAELHRHHRLGDQLRGAGADDVHAEDLVGLRVGEELHHAAGIAQRAVAVSLGIGGALVAGMVAFEPYRPAFIAMALLALGYAGWQVYRRPAAAGESGAVCALPRADRAYKVGFWLVAALAAASIVSPYLAPFFY
jgi:mercuric ion transport protein